MNRLLRYALLAMLATSQIASASKPAPAPPPLCPSELQTRVAANAPPGWEQMPDKAVLTQVGLFGGHPDYASKLNPRSSADGSMEWWLNAAESKNAKPTPWLKCEYSSPGLTLLRPLPASLTHCRLHCQGTCQLSCS